MHACFQKNRYYPEQWENLPTWVTIQGTVSLLGWKRNVQSISQNKKTYSGSKPRCVSQKGIPPQTKDAEFGKVQKMLNLETYWDIVEYMVLWIMASYPDLEANNGNVEKVVVLLPVKWPLPLSAFESGISWRY